MIKLDIRSLKPYQLAQKLKKDHSNPRLIADVIAYLEEDANEIMQLEGSVTMNAVLGRITPGCVLE